MELDEVTAYASAWRRGQSWIAPPNRIPMDYVTRAAMLWRAGECYTVDPTKANAPLWWVPCVVKSAKSGGEAETGDRSCAERRGAPGYVPGEPFVVSIFVSPAPGVNAFAVEEQIPPGWTLSAISTGGEHDAVSGSIKWGPFFDPLPRVCSYTVTSAATACERVDFMGLISMDGASEPIQGLPQVRVGCRLTAEAEVGATPLRWTLSGQAGARFQLEASADLVHWVSLGVVSNRTGRVAFTDPDHTNFQRRFYRATRVE
jgi:hypothetical protein